jgi:hypothetical protein
MAQIILDSNNNLIQGDFDNATLNNRTKLQTTTTNATTNVYVVPNGSSTSAGVSVANNSSLTNASKIVMATNGTTDTQIISGVNGSGTYLPLSFYTNNALAMQVDTSGNVLVSGSSGGLGYGTGSGGTVTQGTSKTTAVSINKSTGQITMNNAALAAGASAGFTCNNSLVSSTDTVIVNVGGGGFGAAYFVVVTYTTSAAFGLRITNFSGVSLSEAVIINFTVIKNATA